MFWLFVTFRYETKAYQLILRVQSQRSLLHVWIFFIVLQMFRDILENIFAFALSHSKLFIAQISLQWHTIALKT